MYLFLANIIIILYVYVSARHTDYLELCVLITYIQSLPKELEAI